MSPNLSSVSTSVLIRLREALEQGRVHAPLTTLGLSSAGFGTLTGIVESCGALDRAGLCGVIEAVLAERRAGQAVRPELVWTGPEGRASLSRDTAVVVQELFRNASDSVLIAGFRFDSGEQLLASLHTAMKERGVSCRIYGDGRDAEELIRRNWPFGLPHPEVYGFAAEGAFASLHAKCIVTDHKRVFVTSANFTDRGHSRNIEVGVVLEDRALAEALERQFFGAEERGAFVRVGL